MTAPTGSSYVVSEHPAGTMLGVPRTLTALAIAAALASATVAFPLSHGSAHQTPPVNMRVVTAASDMEQAIIMALSDLHNRLLGASTELPPEAAQVLYSNLWDLYVG